MFSHPLRPCMVAGGSPSWPVALLLLLQSTGLLKQLVDRPVEAQCVACPVAEPAAPNKSAVQLTCPKPELGALSVKLSVINKTLNHIAAHEEERQEQPLLLPLLVSLVGPFASSTVGLIRHLGGRWVRRRRDADLRSARAAARSLQG